MKQANMSQKGVRRGGRGAVAHLPGWLLPVGGTLPPARGGGRKGGG